MRNVGCIASFMMFRRWRQRKPLWSSGLVNRLELVSFFKTRTHTLNQRMSSRAPGVGLTLVNAFLIHKLIMRGGVKGVQTGVQSETAVKILSSVFDVLAREWVRRATSPLRHQLCFLKHPNRSESLNKNQDSDISDFPIPTQGYLAHTGFFLVSLLVPAFFGLQNAEHNTNNAHLPYASHTFPAIVAGIFRGIATQIPTAFRRYQHEAFRYHSP